MAAQILAVIIFIVMFGLIIWDHIERHIVSLGCGLLTLVLVFGICMHSEAAAAETLSLQSFMVPNFWFQTEAAAESSSGINWATILFIAGMMLMVEGMERAGFFRWLCLTIAKAVHYKTIPIFISFMLMSAFLAMFIDSITVILFLAAVTVELAHLLHFDPIPMIISEIFCSNLGGSATMCGDPPNIIIGTSLGYSFKDFILNTGVATVFVIIVGLICMYFIYGRKLFVTDESIAKVMQLDENKAIKDRKLMHESVIVIILVALCFIFHDQLGVQSCTVAIAAACIMLLIGGQEPEEIIADVEWPTILFFIGLFIVVGGMKKVGVITMLANGLISITHGNMVVTMMVILWVSAIVSSFLDNIPFVATLIPMILTMQSEGMDVAPIWWALSLGACLGGNGTLIGASANVVLSGISKNNGHPITFGQYFKIGFPMMILSIIVCSVFLLIRFA